MLSKKVCYKCLQGCWTKQKIPHDSGTNWFYLRWEDESGVNCYVTGFMLSIHKPPPDKCPYILEHIVEQRSM